MFGRLILQRK